MLTLTGSGNLVAINLSTGASSVVGSTGLGGNANALGHLGTTLYATDLNNNLYTVSPTTGLATPVGATGIPADPTIPFTSNPDGSFNLTDETLFGVDGKLYATFDAFAIGTDGYTTTVQVSPALWEIDPTTGAATYLSSIPLHLLTIFDENGTLSAFQGFPTPATPFPGPEIDLVAFHLSDGTPPLSARLTRRPGRSSVQRQLFLSRVRSFCLVLVWPLSLPGFGDGVYSVSALSKRMRWNENRIRGRKPDLREDATNSVMSGYRLFQHSQANALTKESLIRVSSGL